MTEVAQDPHLLAGPLDHRRAADRRDPRRRRPKRGGYRLRGQQRGRPRRGPDRDGRDRRVGGSAVQLIARSPACRQAAHPSRARGRRRSQAADTRSPFGRRPPAARGGGDLRRIGPVLARGLPRRHRRRQRAGRDRRPDRRRRHSQPAAGRQAKQCAGGQLAGAPLTTPPGYTPPARLNRQRSLGCVPRLERVEHLLDVVIA